MKSYLSFMLGTWNDYQRKVMTENRIKESVFSIENFDLFTVDIEVYDLEHTVYICMCWLSGG